MPLLRCPNVACVAGLKVRDDLVGKKVKCPKCGTIFSVPSQPLPPSARLSAVSGPPNVLPDSTEATSSPSEVSVPLLWNLGDVILDLYEIKHIHEGGGMGLVYRVHHRGWNVDLAVKSPRAEFFRSQRHKENFVRECLTWIGLGLHPHIVCCYYVRLLGGIPRVFAEYIEGGSLEEWIDSGRLYEGGPEEGLKRLLDIAIQSAWGLHYAHEQGLVHQDVKPLNVMMTPDGIAKVTDFGLARARAAASDDAAAGESRGPLVSLGGLGTPAYRSPEQAAGERLSLKTDIWSWAAGVLEMLMGGAPWGMAGSALGGILEEYLSTGEDAPFRLQPPDGLVALLHHCFREDPDDRPKDMREVVQTLLPLYRQHTGEEYPREEAKKAELLADDLNNKALSMLDLGKKEQAEEFFQEALKYDPYHIEATYNLGLLRWRAGEWPDDTLVRTLDNLRTTHVGDRRLSHLLGFVHAERGDTVAAVNTLGAETDSQLAGLAVDASIETARERAAEADARRKPVDEMTRRIDYESFDPNGHWVLSRHRDNSRFLWDLTTGCSTPVLSGLPRKLRVVALSADGQRALAHDGAVVSVWDLPTGGCLRTFECSQEIGHSCLSPDGFLALWTDRRGVLWVLDMESGECRQNLLTPTGGDPTFCLSPDGRLILSIGGDKLLRLWDLATAQCVRKMNERIGGVMALAISSDNRFALSGGQLGSLWLWDLARGSRLAALKGHVRSIKAVCFARDSRRAVSAGTYESVRLWDMVAIRCLRTYSVDINLLENYALRVTADGQWAMLASARGGPPSALDLSVGSPAPLAVALPSGSKLASEVTRVARHTIEAVRAAIRERRLGDALREVARGRKLRGHENSPELLDLKCAIGYYSRRVHLRKARLLQQISLGRLLDWLRLSPDGHWAVACTHEPAIPLVNLASGHVERTFQGHTRSVRAADLSLDGRLLLSGSDDASMRLWDVSTGGCLRVFEGHDQAMAHSEAECDALDRAIRFFSFDGAKEMVCAVALSADARTALATGRAGTLCLWDVATGRRVWTDLSRHHNMGVPALTFGPDGRWAIAQNGSTLARVDFVHMKNELRGSMDSMNAVAVSPDGLRVLVATADKTIHVYDIAARKVTHKLEGHHDGVGAVSFTRDGQWAASGEAALVGDCFVRLWDLAGSTSAHVLQGHRRKVISVSFSADARFLLSGDEYGEVRLWELDWDYEFPGWSDRDEGARPYLEIFLTLHCPYGKDGISRVGKPVWNDEDFEKLVTDLQYRGYGWLRPEGVKRELEKMAANWQGPPPLLP